MKPLSGLWLDFKLGWRVMAKHPGPTVLAGAAMAVAIGICTAAFELVTQLRRPELGFTGGERLVAIQIWDRERTQLRPPSHDEFVAWRDELDLVQQVSGFRSVARNLVIPGGPAGPISVAEISSSALTLTGVTPALGRLFGTPDEQVGAPAVALVGYELWRTRFAAAADIIGRAVQIGGEQVTVIGVMPEGFAFPVNHAFWMPLRAPVSSASSKPGPFVWTFGRLAPGASLETAQAELEVALSRRAAGSPRDEAQLRPRIVPYPQAFLDFSSISASATHAFAVFFLLLMCGNVALLLCVRTAMREGEIAVRSALGATRGRVVAQLVAEALSLSTLAVLAGLGIAALGMKSGIEAFELIDGGKLPFWVSGSLSLRSIAYSAALSVTCALITGILPALNVTSGGLRTRLSKWGNMGASMRLGRIWSLTIVAQVALLVAYVPIFLRFSMDARKISRTDLGIDAAEYLVARVGMDGQSPLWDTRPESSTRRLAAYRGLRQHLVGEPAIVSVAFASAIPGASEAGGRTVDIYGAGGASEPVRVTRNQVDLDYFDALGVTLLAGRGFRAADLQTDTGVVIVNRSFVQDVLGGQNPIGQRIRYRPIKLVLAGMDVPEQASEPWHEIVGVVDDVRFSLETNGTDHAGVYHPATPRPLSPAMLSTPELDKLIVRVVGDPAAFAPTLNRISASVDPSLRLSQVRALDDIRRDLLRGYSSWLRLASLVGGIAALLAVSGVYALLSFTVSHRTREIGIRLTLGASGWHIAKVVCSRLLMRIGLGVIAGGLILALFESLGPSTLTGVPLLITSSLVLLVAGLAACAGPVRHALRVEPAQAIAAEG